MSRTDDGSPGIFSLDRLDWSGPDRLEVQGTFTAAPPEPDAEPLLIVHGEDGAHELRRVAGSHAEPRPGEQWAASFAWQEPPAAFSTAELVLGEIRIDLGYDGRDGAAAGPAAPDVAPGDTPGGTRLRLEAELVAAREHVHALERDLERSRAELERATADLEAERAGRAEDADRFREGLAAVERAAADELLAARAHFDAAEEARAQAEQLRAELQAADARQAEVAEELRAASDDVERALTRLVEVARAPAGTMGRQ